MLDFSGSPLTFGENGEVFVGLFWFFSSTTPSPVAIVKSSFLNCNVYVERWCCLFFVVRLLILLFFLQCFTYYSNYFSFFQLLLATAPRNNDYFPKCLLQRALLFQRALSKVSLPRVLRKTIIFVPVNFLSHICFNIYFYLFIWLLWVLVAQCGIFDLCCELQDLYLVVACEFLCFDFSCQCWSAVFQTRSQLFPIKFGLFPPWTWILVDVTGFYHH